MIKRILNFIFLFIGLSELCAQDKPLVAGMKITHSIKVKKDIFKLDAIKNTEKPVLLIQGDNIVVGKTDNGRSELVSGPFSNKKTD